MIYYIMLWYMICPLASVGAEDFPHLAAEALDAFSTGAHERSKPQRLEGTEEVGISSIDFYYHY